MPASILEGYNVYCDGVRINDTPVSDRVYTTAADGRAHAYRVTAVYDRGESRMSPAALIDGSGVASVAGSTYTVAAVDGAVVISGLNGESVSVAAADGRVVASHTSLSGTCRIPVCAGVYLVTVGGNTTKLIIN